MSNGKIIAGLALGIVGIVFSILSGWFAVLALPCAIVGLCLSVIGGKAAKEAGTPSGMATAGLVVGIVATVISTIAFFTCGLCTICAAGAVKELESLL